MPIMNKLLFSDSRTTMLGCICPFIPNHNLYGHYVAVTVISSGHDVSRAALSASVGCD